MSQSEVTINKNNVVNPYWLHIKGFVAGASSGVAKLVVGHPFDTIKVRLQTEGYGGKFGGPFDCLIQTAKKEGLKGLYKGALLPLFGWSFIDSVMLGTVSYVRKLQMKQKGLTDVNDLSLLDHSIAGFFGGMSCSIVANPIEQIKSRLQVQYNWDSSTQRYKGPFDCMKQLYANNGLKGFFFGMSGTLLFRTFCSVYMGAYEYFKRLLSKYNSNIGIPQYMINFIAGGCGATVFWMASFPADTVRARMMSQPDVPKDQLKYKSLRDCISKVYIQEGGIRGFYRGFVPCLLRSFPTNGAAFLSFELVMKYL
ncbi:hypothetical protein ABK040_012763 [Willaertia magna]